MRAIGGRTLSYIAELFSNFFMLAVMMPMAMFFMVFVVRFVRSFVVCRSLGVVFAFITTGVLLFAGDFSGDYTAWNLWSLRTSRNFEQYMVSDGDDDGGDDGDDGGDDDGDVE